MRRFGPKAALAAVAATVAHIQRSDRTFKNGDAWIGHKLVNLVMGAGRAVPVLLHPYKCYPFISSPLAHRVVLTSNLVAYRNPANPRAVKPQFVFGSHPHGILQLGQCCALGEGAHLSCQRS